MPKLDVKMGKRVRATKADLVCAIPGCTDEPDYHMGSGGWTVVYRDGDWTTKFLCAEHREAWFKFNSKYAGIWERGPGPGEAGWLPYWDKVFDVFLKWVKGELDFCPFCGQAMKTG